MTAFYFTYGSDHDYGLKSYSIIEGDDLTEESARLMQIAMHGGNWSGCYSGDRWSAYMDKWSPQCRQTILIENIPQH